MTKYGRSQEEKTIAELLESLAGGNENRKRCESLLKGIDELCKSSPASIAAALEHALTVPLLMNHMVGTSDLCSELCVSIVWRLCRDSPDGAVMVESLQHGGFQKLLIVAQMAFPERVRDKVCRLIKLFNHFRDGLECADESHFQYLQNS